MFSWIAFTKTVLIIAAIFSLLSLAGTVSTEKPKGDIADIAKFEQKRNREMFYWLLAFTLLTSLFFGIK